MSEFDFHESSQDHFLERIYTAFETTGGVGQQSTSREAANVRRIQAFLRMLGSGDPSPILISLTTDSVMRLAGPPDFPMSGEWHGPQEIGLAMHKNFGYLAEQAIVIERVIAQGDSVVMVGLESGMVRATGRGYDCRWTHIYTFRENKLHEIDIIVDTGSMMQAFIQ